MKKYSLLRDLPTHGLKKGTIFEYDKIEGCYTTKLLPWFLTPLVEKNEIKNKKLFKETK